MILKAKCSNIIIAGDFNLAFAPHETKNRMYHVQEKRIGVAVKDLMVEANLKDIWERNRGFTWRRANTDCFSTIDRILYYKERFSPLDVKANWSLSCSDHAAVEVSFALVDAPVKARSRIPRIDPSLARSPIIGPIIFREVEDMLKTMPMDWDPHKKLEFCKVCIRTVAERQQAERKRAEKLEEELLNEDLNEAIRILEKPDLSENRTNDLIRLIEDLRIRKSALIEEKGKRLAERLGSKWYNEGEKSTKYFMRILNRPTPDDFKTILKDDGSEVTDPNLLKDEIVNFYKDLYEKGDMIEEIDENDFFANISPISDDVEQGICKPITVDELRKTLQACKDSSPGPDGIPYSVIGLMWPIYGPLLSAAWNHSLRTGKLPPSHKLSYLKLIPKLGKDLRRLTNWRPISLSNCDHKIITRTYSKRLSEGLASKIKERQTAYLKGRLINDNIRSLIATIDVTDVEKIEGLLVSLDAKKAFDSVSHSYIELCLERFGCRNFIPIFRTLYSELNTDIIVNGKVEKGFNIKRGVKQGDALSCILFIMCMEPLLSNIEANVLIEPIPTRTFESNLPKVYAYADDVNATIKDSITGINELFKEYERLTIISGLELNADKTEIMRLGATESKEIDFRYMNEMFRIKTMPKIKVNGLILQNNLVELEKENAEIVCSKIDAQLRKWSRRNLSTLGKILIVKTFGISQIIYLMQSIVISSESFKKFNSLLFKFIWNRNYLAAKAPERIKREIMTKPINKGGYGMLDIVALDDSLKLKALGRLATSSHPFLMLLKDKCNFEDFFQPSCPNRLESVLNKGIELLKLDRDKLWDNKFLKNSTSLLQEIKTMSIGKVVNQQGRLSIPFFLIRRRGVTRIADLTPRDLNELERYIENRKLPLIRQARMLPPLNNVTDIKMSIAIKGMFKELGRCTSKEIRESRMSLEPILEYKLGVTLTSAEAASWGHKLSKLTSIRHRVTLLRVAHGEFYTKDKLHRYNLTDDNSCPRCGEVETLVHKFVECEYIARIWQYASLTSNYPSASNGHRQVTYKSILGGHVESTMTVLTLNAEILLKISYLKDEQNYLVHPKTFVKNCLKAIERNERKTKIKEEIKALLQI